MELTDKELAIRWFDRKTPAEKEKLVKQFAVGKDVSKISNDDKEWIWRQQQTI